MKKDSPSSLLRYLLKKFPFDLSNGFDCFSSFFVLIGVCIGALFVGGCLCYYSGWLGVVWMAITIMSGVMAIKMNEDFKADEYKAVYIVYLSAAEILSGFFIIHILWWICNIPINIVRYKNGE